jgi:hypothetical protein
MSSGVFDEIKSQLANVNKEVAEWTQNNEALIRQKVPEYIDQTKDALKKIWDIISYDPAILEWGLVGLALGGKKGAILAGGLAHIKTMVETQAAAFGLASTGAISYTDIAKANFEELQKIVKDATKDTETFYRVTRDPAKGYKEPAKAADELKKSTEGAGAATKNLVEEMKAAEASQKAAAAEAKRQAEAIDTYVKKLEQ